MRQIKFFSMMMMALALSMTSCSKDDDDGAGPSGIQGEWEMESMNFEGESTTTIMGQTFTSTFSGDAKDIDLIMDMKADNTVESQGGYTIVIEYEFSGQKFEQEQTFQDLFNRMDYEINGDIITFTDEMGDTLDAEIITQTSSTLVFRARINTTSTDNGFTVDTYQDGTYTFKR